MDLDHTPIEESNAVLIWQNKLYNVYISELNNAFDINGVTTTIKATITEADD